MRINFPFLKYKKIYFIFSAILIAGSLISILVFGLKFGIEFTGGSLIELDFSQGRPASGLADRTVVQVSKRGARIWFSLWPSMPAPPRTSTRCLVISGIE